MLDKEILMEKLDSMEPIIEYLDDPEINAISTFLADRIASPDSFVTLLGETSSGKSTLINSAEPSTGPSSSFSGAGSSPDRRPV